MGTDIEPGTYRATAAVGATCYWGIYRSGSNGGGVLQTAAGIEALRCSGLAETLVYDRVPTGLSARPTLSVKVKAMMLPEPGVKPPIELSAPLPVICKPSV